ncbi:MAG: GIY-YIG nuclease family protein [Synergistaceae bacterium]|uniref:GIY-YIG nuclease family protein n=1 Tax=Aminivibrio sp. TaxID=1872489 RepID=UPI002A1F1218|nr:GIY-YIG nuclease family protein [Synergistaceae bacterium]MDD3389914.1 GIY-YIG nuclease family protein [Synergistaceae bacterium]MDD4021537.1 GIY-YIG nuclease family protein [Synergistaceae bacterium]MDD4612273.1 GIY-YIG nuclease family protein [Synergistaceae bacterium]
MLRCSDGTLYTGWTFDLSARLEAHNSGRGAKYTSGRRPLSMVYCERMETKNEALRREMAIKRMPRKGKERLVASMQGSNVPEGGKKV